jgi:hypothetical protein
VADPLFKTASVEKWEGFALNDLAAKAFIRRAEADEKIAESTTASPARQESVRVSVVVAGLIVLTIGGHLCGLSDGLLEAAIVAIGGIYAVPKAIEKIRGPLPKPLPMGAGKG